MSQRHLAALALFLLSALQSFSSSAFPDLSAITTERYPDADSVLVDEIIRTRYAADGSAFTRAETFVKILTEKGLRENRTHSMAYNIFYESTVVTLARIIHPDGTATPIDIAANTKEMTNRRSMAANIYDPNNKILTLALPGLKVGDTLHIVKETTTKRPRMKDTFCDWQSFESTSPIIRSTYEVRGPKDKPLAATAILDKNGDTLTAATRVEGDEIIHTWIARDVPQAFPEPSMPAFYICTQRLLVSTVATWEEVSKWYSSICEPHLASTPEIDAKVAELIAPPAGSTTPLTDDEKIRRVFRFVSQEIRYMGITLEKDSPGFEPHDVSLTFNNRYGVCRDKAALLVTMLRAAGFDAAPVLINAGPLVDPEVPKIYFNHAVTAVRLADGTDILMDSTDENTADLFPSYLANKSYLVARAEGDTLRVSPVAPPEENMLRAATRITIADDGSATGDITLDFSGINDNAYRGSFARAKPEDIRRWLETLLKNQIPGATLTAHEITPRNAMDTTRPLHAAISFSAPDYFTVARGKTILNTPWFGADFSIASRFLGNGTALAKRRFPLEIPYTCGLDETLTLNLPPRIGDTLALPDETRVELPAVTYEKTFTRNKNVITGKLAMRLRAPRVAEGEPYAQLKDALKDIEYSDRQAPVLAAKSKTQLTPDIRTLNNELTITLDDAHNWTRRRAVRKQVLTYAGKKNHSEIKLNYNPVWETVTLDHATVTLKDGGTRTVSPEEINIMDAPWVARAPRYPAAKTMVISLPGVEEGATIDTQITTTHKNKPWFALSQSYFGFDPIDAYTFTLNTAAGVNLSTTPALAALADSPDENQNPKTGTRFRVSGSRTASPREGALPPRSYLGPVYQATTLNNPADYARLINAAVAPLAEPTAAIRAKAAELTAAAKTETDRVVAIRDYIARHVRNAGPNFTDLPLSCLTPAEKTLADAYGNTADRAILLAALLRAAGLEPEFLLAGSRVTKFYWQEDDLFPADSFSHLAVRVQADGETCYLDHLSLYADPHATSLEDCMVIALATGKIETITPAPKYQTTSRTDWQIILSPEGDAAVTFTAPHYGANHESLKRRFTEMTPEDRDRYHQSCMTWISQAAQPRGGFETNLDYPATYSFSADVARYAVRSGDYLYFQLPAASTSPTPAGPDTRIHPLFATAHRDSTIQWTITLPEGLEVEAAPENLSWTGPGDYGQIAVITATKTENARTTLTITQTINLNPAVIPAASYSTLLELNRRLSQPSQWRVLLKKIKK
ncbi:transglutaminase-like putative cysteine protease [Ereboglobus sp. PH5-10]|uniref:DUF3857 domain-containing protein n=1 Tax=Ereboglobus sp. PH5-10 TaxID=2940629 RepID=UPI0024066378|nr:DUF3857 domain-containing protein [Ereboglobus sp. PH5-10]MDF9826661.1 transglutaminase-like putative cysteine protease [Ereboglobus sp. PH5-10]